MASEHNIQMNRSSQVRMSSVIVPSFTVPRAFCGEQAVDSSVAVGVGRERWVAIVHSVTVAFLTDCYASVLPKTPLSIMD